MVTLILGFFFFFYFDHDHFLIALLFWNYSNDFMLLDLVLFLKCQLFVKFQTCYYLQRTILQNGMIYK